MNMVILLTQTKSAIPDWNIFMAYRSLIISSLILLEVDVMFAAFMNSVEAQKAAGTYWLGSPEVQRWLIVMRIMSHISVTIIEAEDSSNILIADILLWLH